MKTCIFDAYGTLFDVNAAARKAAQLPGNEQLAQVWTGLARDWRLKQLEYSWLRTIMQDHVDFWQITQDGLDWAMAAQGLDDADMRQALLDLYWQLAAYAEVPAMLTALKNAGAQTAILSNGSKAMLETAVSSAGLGDLLDAVLSVDDVGLFKPARQVYDMVGQRFDVTPDQVLFVSSNGWDVAGASAYGFETVWVNRARVPVDQMPGKPAHIARDLTDIYSKAMG